MTEIHNGVEGKSCEEETHDFVEKGMKSESSGAVHARGYVPRNLLFSVNQVPPWYLCIGLGFQNFLTAAGGIIGCPLIISRVVCMTGDNVGISELIATMFMVAGLSTMLQSSLGTRLPIMQGASAAFFVPVFALMAQPEWRCPYTPTANITMTNLPELGSEGHKEIWKSRLRVFSGSMMVGSMFQVFLGATGVIGYILRFIGPLSICPTILLIGLSLTDIVAEFAAKQWYIAVTVSLFLALFSQYFKNYNLRLPGKKKGMGFPVFQLFPVVLAIVSGWLLSYILTVTGALPTDPNQWGYEARTDLKISVLSDSKWFRFPYPGQWGTPTVAVAGVVGIMTGAMASIIESIGDYTACAKLSGAPPPPVHAVNRGIVMEGIGCFMCGIWGTGAGTTSYSENIAAISLTKVGSRRVVFVAGLIMCILSCFGKFTAVIVAIPDPVLGGVFIITLGMVSAIGLSSLQYVDLGSSRNLFIIGVSIFFGLLFPSWLRHNLQDIETGSSIADQVIGVLLSTHMFVGGCIGFILDNTIPGTNEERGLIGWNSDPIDSDADIAKTEHRRTTYDLPFVQKYLNKWTWLKRIPFCPTYQSRMNYS